jgi:hypothetical protein
MPPASRSGAAQLRRTEALVGPAGGPEDPAVQASAPPSGKVAATAAAAAPPQIDVSLLSALDASLKEPLLALTQPLEAHIRSITLTPASRVDATTGAVRGYVVLADGSAPVRDANGLFINDRTGTGVSWFTVVPAQDSAAAALRDDDGGLAPALLDESAVLRSFARAAKDAYSVERDAPGMSVGLYSYSDGFDTRYTVVVRGRDDDAYEALADKIELAAEEADARARHYSDGDNGAGGQPRYLSLHEVAASKEYVDLLRRSAALRDSVARRWAAAHGVALAPGTAGSHDTHFIVFSKAHSRDAPGSGKAPQRAYLVFDDTLDPASARGGVLLYRGPVAGYSLLQNKERADGEGRRTRAWANDSEERAFSLFPTHSGMHRGESNRARGMHRTMNAKIARAAARRIHWGGPVRKHNPAADEIYYDDDATTLKWLGQLGADPGNNIARTHLKLVAMELPGLDPRPLSLAQLVRIADVSGEAALPVYVGTSNNVVTAIVRSWPTLRRKLGTARTLADVLRHENDDGTIIVVDTDVLRATQDLDE